MMVMIATETERMARLVMNQESRSTPSPRPIIFMNSRRRTYRDDGTSSGNCRPTIAATAHTHTHTHTHKHTQIDTYRQTDTHTQSPTHTVTHTHTHTHTDRQTDRQTHTVTHTDSHPPLSLVRCPLLSWQPGKAKQRSLPVGARIAMRL